MIKTRNKFNVTAIKSIAKKYDLSERYIRDIMNDHRTPIFSDKIKSEYKELVKKLEEVIKENQQLN